MQQVISIADVRESRHPHSTLQEDLELARFLSKTIREAGYDPFCRFAMAQGAAGRFTPDQVCAALQIAGIVKEHMDREQARVLPFLERRQPGRPWGDVVDENHEQGGAS